MNTRTLLYALSVALLIPATAAAAIISGPTMSPSNGHIYYLLFADTWTSSEAEAITLGGHLSTVRDDAENAFLIATFGNFSGQPRDLWIGLNDVAEEGTFVWASGEPFSYAPAGSALNTDIGGEDYVHIIRAGFADSGAWNDFPNGANPPDRLANGVVEIIPEPGIISGPVINPSNGHSYLLLSNSSWTSAEAEAISLGGHLATVRSDAENAFLISAFGNFSGQSRDLWIGLNDAAEEGTFVWASGEPFSYAPAGSALNTDIGGEDYVHIIRAGFADSGAWNDFPNGANPPGRLANGVVEIIPEPATSALLLIGFSAFFLCRHRVYEGRCLIYVRGRTSPQQPQTTKRQTEGIR